ncbi:hypothetical protein H4R19_000651 [Coemansia spiralis]|nr:hypothetical protein H4R19_000651 [Coemansia spiralis]
MNDPYIDSMGIFDENMETFAGFLCHRFDRLGKMAEDMSKIDYRRVLCSLLAPAGSAGFMVIEELLAGNGRADLVMMPAGSRNSARQPRPACFVFQLKVYDGPVTTDAAVQMDQANRHLVAAHAWGQARDAQTQIYDCCFDGIASMIVGCKTMYVIGLTFWGNRFCMVVTKRTRSTDKYGCNIWPVGQLSDDKEDTDLDVPAATWSSVDYDSLGDELGSPTRMQVRFRYRCRHLTAICI